MTDQPALPFDPCPDTAASIRPLVHFSRDRANERDHKRREAAKARAAAESGVPAQRRSDVRGYVLAAVAGGRGE